MMNMKQVSVQKLNIKAPTESGVGILTPEYI